MQKCVVSNNEYSTIALGRAFAENLSCGDVIVLSGDLGAGKTKFVSGVLSFFGKDNEASSPTFTIINEHQLSNDLKLFHFDVYRFDFADEFTAIGGEEFFDKGICMIEWGEKIESLLPKNYLKIEFLKDTDDENLRRIIFTPHGKRYEELIENLPDERV